MRYSRPRFAARRLMNILAADGANNEGRQSAERALVPARHVIARATIKMARDIKNAWPPISCQVRRWPAFLCDAARKSPLVPGFPFALFLLPASSEPKR